jgi:hypothetical protein
VWVVVVPFRELLPKHSRRMAGVLLLQSAVDLEIGLAGVSETTKNIASENANFCPQWVLLRVTKSKADEMPW